MRDFPVISRARRALRLVVCLVLTSSCQRAYYPLSAAGGYAPAALRPDTATFPSPAVRPAAAEAAPPAASALPLAAPAPERPRQPRPRLLKQAAPPANRAFTGRLPPAVRSSSPRSPVQSRPFLGWSADAWINIGLLVVAALLVRVGVAVIAGGGLLAVVGGLLLMALALALSLLALYVFLIIK